MGPTEPEVMIRPPWQVCLTPVAGETHYKVRGHVAPSVILDRAYWSGGDAGPTDAFNYLVHDDLADVADYRVGLGWVIAAAPAMRAALRDVLAARSSDELAAALDKARDALALAALPIGDPTPPAGGHVEAVSLQPLDINETSPSSIPKSRSVAELVAHMAEFGPRKFELWAMAVAPGGDVECRWDADTEAWTPWAPVR